MKLNISAKIYLILILVLSGLIVWPVFLQGYFFHHDDLQVMRVFEMRKCFNDLQLPCRWVPDMGYGNGYPLFNYYSALPYYIGGVSTYFFSFVDSAKILFFIPLVLGGISMFLLAQKLYGKEAGFLAGILYAFAPYRALDSFVRGAIAESFALAIIPLVFYFVLKTAEKPTKWNIVFGSLSLAAFLTSHNIMTMFFMPFLLIWILMTLYFQKWKNLKPLILSFLLGIGLSAFFLLPVFLEKNLVQTETLLQGGSNFRTHFVTVSQIFIDRTWGYGGSQFGPVDTISFQIGWPLWWFVLIAIPLVFITFKKNIEKNLIGVLFLTMFLISIFMMHNKSAFIWEMIDSLQYAQFPWRFLSLSIFACSLLGAYYVSFLKTKWQMVAVTLISALTIFLNWNFFTPREFYPWINDQQKLADPLWEIQQKAGVMDYLPRTAFEPLGRAVNYAEVLDGNAQTSSYDVLSNSFSFNVDAIDKSTIQVPVFDFPNWEVFANGVLIPHNNNKDLGRIVLELEPGQYMITGKFADTPVRVIGNTLSLISLILLVLMLVNESFANKFARASS